MLKEYQEELYQEPEEFIGWRASMVGNPCETFLCHTRLESELAEPVKGRVNHMLEDGKLHEEDIVRRCIAAGYEVLHSCLDKQLELKISINKNVVVSGHPDGILKCGKLGFDLDRADPLFKFNRPCYLLEITAPSTTNFALLVKDGLKIQNYQKYIQTQIYMMSDRV